MLIPPLCPTYIFCVCFSFFFESGFTLDYLSITVLFAVLHIEATGLAVRYQF